MILSALYQYYNEVSKTGQLAPIGMSYEKISFIIVITQEGDFVRLEDLRGGDSPEGRSILVVQPVGRTSDVSPNWFWDKPIYSLGWEDKKGCPHLKSFVEKVSEFCAKYPEEKDLEAVRRFYAQEKAFRECFESFSETVSKTITLPLQSLII